MHFDPSREAALKKLNNFIESGLYNYSKLRNFDFGPDKRSNISCLSPYITHGIISEKEVIKLSLKKFSFPKNEKFIQEVLWRIYWKGWLELRPNVWSDYLTDLKKLKQEYINNKDYLDAIEGKTKIECFNSWVEELKNYNYLHNHARMWFASIWIFTLGLPWQLGAEFFMRYLFDGDSSSNTLGWRWVAGIQTKGKNYVASEWNIKKFTNNRFKNIKLHENPIPVRDNKNYSIINNSFLNTNLSKNQDLLIFENNISFDQTDFRDQSFRNIYFVFNGNEIRQIKLDEKVINFKKSLINDQIENLKKKSLNCKMINIEDLKDMRENFLALYPTVGENLDFINLNDLKNISFLYRKIDQYSWKYCNKGFFNFKNYIPKIVQEFI
ncbi:MAG: FAD-binding domain-containing protein [Candidatus Pelagibacter sp.]